LKEMRAKQRTINAKLKAERDTQRLAARELKAKIKAEVDAIKAEEKAAVQARKAERFKATMHPAAPEGYKPAKTAWAFPPPWSH
jgi:hypothetical protein